MEILRFLALAAILVSAGFAQRVGAPTSALDQVSPDELFSIQVTSVGRKAERLLKAPAAVFVLTADDIRRSGATSIPEALEWVPGLTVLRLDDRSWVVSARGGARMYANKMLVMIDGRELYTPLFSGVIWDSVDVPLNDIEQIEVVRGPGAVMWGPNAVNGVINVITKRSQATRGAQVSATAGNDLSESTEIRWGGGVGNRVAYRVWAKSDYRTPAYHSPAYSLPDGNVPFFLPRVDNLNEETGRIGFRVDGQAGTKDEWTVEGDLFKMGRQDPWPGNGAIGAGTLAHAHSDYFGGSVNARWTRTESPSSDTSLQLNYDSNDIHYPALDGVIHNLTVDFQKRRRTGERNELFWGGGYQQYWDDIPSVAGRSHTFLPPSSVYRAGHVVLRDEFELVPERWRLSAGVRLDYTSYGPLEYQPSLRLLFTPDARQSVWAAVSRAERLPNRIDRDLQYHLGEIAGAGIPVELWAYGSKAAKPETVRSMEMGYRIQSGQRWSVDTSVYWSYYGRLSAVITSPDPQFSFVNGAPLLRVSGTYANPGAGRSFGGEIWGEWQVRPGWRLIPSYSYLNEKRWLPQSSNLIYSWDAPWSSVPHQGQLRSQFDLWRNWKLDLMARARSRNLDEVHPGVLLLDARLGWRPSRSTEISIAVQDLANRHVFESFPEYVGVSIPVRRTFALKLTQRF